MIRIFKIKGNPFRELIKHKARLCVHSSIQQEEIDFHSTFALVINWFTIMIIIMMAEMAGW